MEEPTQFLNLAGDDILAAEDEERNKKQAKRNRGIRSLLERRRVALPEEIKPAAFAEVETIAPTASPSPNGEEEHDDVDDDSIAPQWLALRDEPSINLRLHEELLDFANFMRPSPMELDARQAFAARIEAAAKETLGENCQVHLFGSTSTGLNLPSADIDVTVAGVEGVRATTAMKRIANWLLEKGDVSQISIVQSARVPVAKLQQRSTGLWADVIINRLDGLETSKFIRDHLEIYPALGPLVLFLKLFLLQRGLHETFGGGLGSYLLVCLVLSFLQRHPSAKNLQTHAKTSLGNLLFDFFRHYGQEFRYGAVGISLLNGGSLFDRIARGFTATTRTGQATLCLESPTEAGVDIGARCFKIGVVRACFNHAYHSLGKLFLSKEAPGPSLLCPLLVNQKHDIIKNRYQLMKVQPAPLIELPEIPDSDDEGDGLLKSPTEAKRRRLDGTEADNSGHARHEVEESMESAAPDGEVQQRTNAGTIQVDRAELEFLEELGADDLSMGEVPQAGQPALQAHSDFLSQSTSIAEIVGEDEHNLDEAGLFLQAMAEAEAEAVGRSPPPQNGSGNAMDAGFAQQVPVSAPFEEDFAETFQEEVRAEELELIDEIEAGESFGVHTVVASTDPFTDDFVSF